MPAFVCLSLLVVVTAFEPSVSAQARIDPDSLFLRSHPRLAFDRSEIPLLRARLRNGGADDAAYAAIKGYVANLYRIRTFSELMDITYGMNIPLDAGLVAHLDEPENSAARELGRTFTLALADSFVADDDPFYTSIRLRSLCYGYDLCMDDATPAERSYVRGEIESYIDSLMYAFNFERWLHPPYTSNKTAMTGAALGIAAICLADEMEPARVAAALARADAFVETWIQHDLDPDGSCFEGVQYGTWAMRHLAWYFEARRRYDGTDYSRRDDIQRIERWLAYEVLPAPGGVVNNLNETASLNYPVAKFNTCLEWAVARWQSPLAGWLRDRLVGPNADYDWGPNADQAATALWNEPVSGINPGDALPRSFLWRGRGLYYYRTGWASHGGSDDVVFSFYSGVFHGGHSQEDQGSFTLYAHGGRFAADNGFDPANGVSEAHNMVFVDGRGQHYSGKSVGTDGDIPAHLISTYADYLFGDQTAAYGTHSPFNTPGVPFPDDDWSYGYAGANPVEHAYREWLVIHEGATPPYFVLLDDVKKDGMGRDYEWRMHTDSTHAVDLSGEPLRISGARGLLEIDLCHPAMETLQRVVTPFVNRSADPSTEVIRLGQHAQRGLFALVLRPTGTTGPATQTSSFEWGGIDVISWPGGITDIVLAHAGTDTVTANAVLADGKSVSMRTDARLLHVRRQVGKSMRTVLARATLCDVGAIPVLRARDRKVTAVVAGDRAFVDHADANVTLYAPDARSLQAGDTALAFSRDGAFIVISGTGSAPATATTPRLIVYPQPTSGSATLVVETASAGHATVEVFDVAGRRVRGLFDAPLARGRTLIPFDGRNDLASPLASGVYFARVRTGSQTTTCKIILVR